MFSRAKWTGLVSGLAAAIVMLTGQPANAAIHSTYGFEQSFDGWIQGYFGEGTYTMDRTVEQSYNGQYSVECYLDGTSGSGIAWMAHSFRAPVQTLAKLKLTFQLYNPARSDINNFAVMAFIGTEPPRSEADFQFIGYADTVIGWRKFDYLASTMTGRDPTYVWVAFGISSVWEYSREYYMDKVTVSLKP
jgi:hypothetical protein